MRNFSRILVAAFVMITAMQGFAQDKPASPKAEVNATVGAAKVNIVYCQPSARGRKVMGALVPFGEVWRTGANEATTIQFDKDVTIEGQKLAAGKYSLFTVPNENEWTVIFNSDTKQWGHYNYNKEKDVLRVNVKPIKTKDFVETFVISTEKNQVVMKWENTAVAFNVK
jgi:hypothetical protein